MTYWELFDEKHKGEVLRIDGSHEYIYRNGDWLETGLSPSYLLDYGDCYGEFREISEAEAMRLIAESEN